MRSELETLLEEFERLTLDNSLFFRFSSADEIEVHVQYRQAEGRNWSIWFPINPAASRQTVSRQHFPLVLNAFGVSDEMFMEELQNILLTQAAWADEFVRDVGRLLGEESVSRAIGDTQRFMSSFRDLVRDMEKGQEPPSTQPDLDSMGAEVRSPESLAYPTGRTRLRIVRPT